MTFQMLGFLCAVASVFLLTPTSATNPYVAKWSTKSYGPDGPWQAVSVQLGSPAQSIDLLPGGSWMSIILAPTVCASPDCPSAAAGFYDSTKSKTPVQISSTATYTNTSFVESGDDYPNLLGDAKWIFDTLSINVVDGVSGAPFKVDVPNFDALVVSKAVITLPDSTTYVPQIGTLALGAPNTNQSWTNGGTLWNGTEVAGYLNEQARIPSNSVGLHVGSVALGIAGSLTYGGYDGSRVLGPVSSQPYGINHLPIDLLDIGIGVAEGQSPFSYSSKSGILAQGNSSVGLFQTVSVQPTAPYLYLPKSTCDAITQDLPVTYQPNLGLYFWNTLDPRYQAIVSSSAFLSFTFRLNSSISQNFTINVPFRLLNLTLTTPLVTTPTQYLPCKPYQMDGAGYTLGRSFLQAAFLGVNWQTGGQGKGSWFLAQAPGPNTPSNNPPTSMAPTDNFIIGSTNDWVTTWKGAWKVIEASGNSTSSGSNTTGSGTGGSSPNTSDKKDGISTGAIVGIVVGVIALLVGLGLGVFFYLRRRKQKVAFKDMDYTTTGELPQKSAHEIGSDLSPTELHTGRIVRELDARDRLGELPTGHERHVVRSELA
ncbi:aspartic-type endopeptidase-like protein [Halenospora varia]|nr:aspartic-type endopeptidase-like protein [Halenospora varia]